MRLLERTPFRWSQIVLPVFYLALGVVVGYVAPIMWGARPGKEEVRVLRKSINHVEWGYQMENLRASFTRMVLTEASPDFVVNQSRQGERWNFREDNETGKQHRSQSLIVGFLSPTESASPEKRREVEAALHLMVPKFREISLSIVKLNWDVPGELEIEYDWTFTPGRWKYQTSDFLRELYW